MFKSEQAQHWPTDDPNVVSVCFDRNMPKPPKYVKKTPKMSPKREILVFWPNLWARF